MTTITVSENQETVENIYQHFSQGNIPAIMAVFTSNALVEHNGNTPWSGKFEGLSDIGNFFQGFATVEVRDFQTSNFREVGNTITNDGYFSAIARTTGKPLNYNLTMAWTFDTNGKVIHYKGAINAAQVAAVDAAFKKLM